MSGFTDTSECPICRFTMTMYSDSKPFEHISLECMRCGFYSVPKVGQIELEDINVMRVQHNEGMDSDSENKLKPLTKGDLAKYEDAISDIW